MENLGTNNAHQEKPNLSYAALIKQAIRSSKEGKMKRNDIYRWITDNFPYYQRLEGAVPCNHTLKIAIRLNLAINKQFVKTEQGPVFFSQRERGESTGPWSRCCYCDCEVKRSSKRKMHIAQRSASENAPSYSPSKLSTRTRTALLPICFACMPVRGSDIPLYTFFTSPPTPLSAKLRRGESEESWDGSIDWDTLINKEDVIPVSLAPEPEAKLRRSESKESLDGSFDWDTFINKEDFTL